MAGNAYDFWTELLQLSDYEVVHFQVEAAQKHYCFTVVPKCRVGVCPNCGKASDQVHQTRNRERIKDLPISNHSVDLTVRIPQFECADCGQCFTPPVPFLVEGTHATERFLERAAELIGSSDVANIAKFFGLPERTLADWYYDYLPRHASAAAAKLKPIRRLGIDELSLKKNIGNSSP